MDDVNLAVVRVETTGSVLEAQYLTEPHAFTRAEVDLGSRAFSGQFAIGQFQAASWRFRYSSLTSFGVL